MNPLTHFKNTGIFPPFIVLSLVIGGARAAHAVDISPAPVAYWSTEARKAIVPPSAGAENYGHKFPGEAAVYMGIVHVAIYDAAVAIEGGYEYYAEYDPPLPLPNASSAAAIATAVHHTLVGPPDTGLQPALGLTQAQEAILNGIYDAYMASIPDGEAKTNGRTIGERVAAAIVTLRQNDGRDAIPPFNPPPPGPGVWERNPGNPLPPILGLVLPGITPLALESASQFRPTGRTL